MMKRRRWWLQMHLSTALWLMLAAGGLMWLNVRNQAARPLDQKAPSFSMITEERGWPWIAYANDWIIEDLYEIYWRNPHSGVGGLDPRLETRHALLNAAVATAILFIIWLSSEYRIHRVSLKLAS